MEDEDMIERVIDDNKMYCLTGAEYGKMIDEAARVRELEAENAELKTLYANVTMALYDIDPKTFGPLTAREGVMELRRQLEQAQATAKSNGEMWAQADTMYKRTINEQLEDANTIRELKTKVEQLERECAYLSSTDHAADIDLARFERTAPIDWREVSQLSEWEAETPLGQQLDGLGDEVES